MNEEIIAKARALLGMSGPLHAEALALAQAYEALRMKVQDLLVPEYLEGTEHEEWADDESDAAIKGFLFWWIWGN